MTGAIAPLEDVSAWGRGNLLVIILLVLGALLLTRLAEWARGLIMKHIDAHANEADELVRSEAAKYRHVVAQVVTWTVLAVIYVVTAVLIIQHLGVPLAGLVAPVLPCSAPPWGSACSASSRTSAPGCSSPESGNTASATSSASRWPALRSRSLARWRT